MIDLRPSRGSKHRLSMEDDKKDLDSMVLLNMNPGWDHWLFVKNPPQFTNVVRADSMFTMVSGKGTNVARVFNTLGFHNYRCMTVIGGLVGERIKQDFEKEHIHATYHCVTDESRINFCVIREYEHNALQIFNEMGPELTLKEAQGFIDSVRKLLDKDPQSPLVISGSAPRGVTSEHLNSLIAYAIGENHPVFADIGGEWLKEIIAYPISLLKVNREEFALAFDIDMDETERIRHFKDFHKIGTIIITDGRNGCKAWNSDGCIFSGIVSSPPQNVGFTIGCGDSFFAGYLAACARNLSFKERLVLANACGIANTLSFGPANFSLEDLNVCFEYVQVEPL